MPTVKLTAPQAQYYSSNAAYVAAVAGFGSGKTQSAITRLMSTKTKYPEIDLAYLAPTYSLIRDIFYPKISSLLNEMNLAHSINKGENIIHIHGHGSIFCRTMDNPDMIVGWEVGDAFIDEFDILPTDKALQALRKIAARCRQNFPDGKRNQKFISTTPEGFKATYKLFKETPLPDSHLIQMSTYSNAHNLPDGYIDDLISQYPEQQVKAYLMGEFVNLSSGAVYTYFDRNKHNTHYIAAPREPLHIGMDFNVYHMAASVHIIRDGVPYMVDEFVDILDTPSMIDALKSVYAEHRIIVYPDASGDSKSSTGATESDIRQLKRAGLSINAPKKNPPIKDRVASVNCKFENGDGTASYFINTERCPVTTLALEQQVYDKNGLPDKTEGHDHKTDSIGYFIHRRWPVGRPAPLVTPIGDFSSEVDHSI